MIAHVRAIAPWATGDASMIKGGYYNAKKKLASIDPIRYGRTRNFETGCVTQLSPYISHGIIDLHDSRAYALKKCSFPAQITKFIQELAWRDFWHRVATYYPDWLWTDVEPYKTGHQTYASVLPDDIKTGQTDTACINAFIHDLLRTGYLHNHARLYLASYIVHHRRIQWQAGAHWFLSHLLDGDEASNNFSWQWVASTFSNKPYIATLDNIAAHFPSVDTHPSRNKRLAMSYDDLAERLFLHA